MDDLISRQAVIDLWDKYHPYIATKAIEYDRELRALPSAQPERKKGKWVRDEFGIYCSCCGFYAYRDKFGKPWESNFCPNCGADMREEKTDEYTPDKS